MYVELVEDYENIFLNFNQTLRVQKAMIKTINNDGMYAPVIICDICGKAIDNASLAAVIDCERPNVGEMTEVRHVHKGKCHDLADARWSELPWAEMDVHLLNLINNVGSSLEKLQEVREARNKVGIENWGKI